MRTRLNTLRRGLLATLVALAALAFAGSALASRCTNVSGPFIAYTYFPPSCGSQIGICIHSTLSDSFLGSDDLTFDTLVSAADPSDPSKFLYTGDSLLMTDTGRTIYGQDTGVIHITSDAIAPFVTTVTIVAGTRQYANASGQLVESGELDFVTRLAIGTYTGTVCKSSDDEGEAT